MSAFISSSPMQFSVDSIAQCISLLWLADLRRHNNGKSPFFWQGKMQTQQVNFDNWAKQSKESIILSIRFWFRSPLDPIITSIGFICFVSSIISWFRLHLNPMTTSTGLLDFVSSICSCFGSRLNPTVTSIGFLITIISSIGSCFGSRLNREKTSIGFLSGKLKFRIIILALLLNTASSFIVMENTAQKVQRNALIAPQETQVAIPAQKVQRNALIAP